MPILRAPVPDHSFSAHSLLWYMTNDDIDVRAVRTHDELRACVSLQRDTWGQEFTDVVPASILKVSQRVGGITAGGFAPDGRLLGFVFGLTGVENGRIVHWSDLLAVTPAARNLGLGRRLKQYQRRLVRALGAEVIYWTYDPLVARNAHLNFNVFGVRAVQYVEDMYGDTQSDLHAGMATDRFIVAWPTEDAATQERLRETHAAGTSSAMREAPILNAGAPGAGSGVPAAGLPPMARVEIPLDIAALQQRQPDEARRWRESTGDAFQLALAAGLTVRGFVVDECAKRGYYLLAN